VGGPALTESPTVPPRRTEDQNSHFHGHTGRRDADREKQDSKRQTKAGPDAVFNVHALSEHVETVKSELKDIFDSVKSVRIDKARLTAQLENLKASLIEKKKERLHKEAAVASGRARLQLEKSTTSLENNGDIERLKLKIDELKTDIETFREAFRLHRRDRDRAFQQLCDSQSKLQDCLTQEVLWKIVQLEAESDDETARQGLPGITAELLGRLLVLEKEECQLGGFLDRYDREETD